MAVGKISGGSDIRGKISGSGDLRGHIAIKHGVDGLGLPKPSQDDAGKIPVVNEDGYGYELRTFESGNHVDLKGRDEADQHSMSAITGLETALANKQPKGNYLIKETDPTVPYWAKQPSKPTYTADEVGADVIGTAQKLVAEHNTNTEAHNDIRIILNELVTKVTTLLDSDDDTLDQMSEVVTYIKANREVIESVTISKVNVTDIIDNLETNLTNKVLSASCGVRLKAMIDAIEIVAMGKADSEHSHDISDINYLQTTLDNKANADHNHTAAAIDQGTFHSDRLPTVPITKGGTGATSVENARANLDVYSRADVDTKIGAIVIPTKVSAFENDSKYVSEDELSSKVNSHNTNVEAHNDIRIILNELVQKVTTLLDSDDDTLDQMSEVVTYIKANREVIESVTTSKVNIADIIDNLETNLANKVLSAACGVRLKSMIDAIVIPTKVSAFENDAGYLIEHQDISGKVNESELEGKVKGILTTEEWTFELEDGSIVTKKVVII